MAGGTHVVNGAFLSAAFLPQSEACEEEMVKLSSSQLGWLRPSVSVSFSIPKSSAAGIRVQSRAALGGGCGW